MVLSGSPARFQWIGISAGSSGRTRREKAAIPAMIGSPNHLRVISHLRCRSFSRSHPYDPEYLNSFRIESVPGYAEQPIAVNVVKREPIREGQIAQPDPRRIEHRPALRKDHRTGKARVEEAEGLFWKGARPDASPVIQHEPVEERLVSGNLGMLVERREQHPRFRLAGRCPGEKLHASLGITLPVPRQHRWGLA